MNRYKKIVNEYDTTIFVEEALYRLVELNYKLGLVNEAKNMLLDTTTNQVIGTKGLIKLLIKIIKNLS